MRTRARAELAAITSLKNPERRTVTGIAHEIGVSQPTVSAWLNGTTRPDAHLRAAIERVLGIKADGWMTDAEFRVAFGRARAA